jgi:hypothetical protein
MISLSLALTVITVFALNEYTPVAGINFCGSGIIVYWFCEKAVTEAQIMNRDKMNDFMGFDIYITILINLTVITNHLNEIAPTYLAY